MKDQQKIFLLNPSSIWLLIFKTLPKILWQCEVVVPGDHIAVSIKPDYLPLDVDLWVETQEQVFEMYKAV